MLLNSAKSVTVEKDGPDNAPLHCAEEVSIASNNDPLQQPLRTSFNRKAVDVTVDNGIGDSEMADIQAGSQGRDDCRVAVSVEANYNTRVCPRRMGDVYPIMKNTIYSDEECDHEVVLTNWDWGTLFIRYLHGIFEYFVRNPKAMGLIFTTAIILLFFKYSQQVVVKAVNAAVRAHPGLEPSDALRSAVVAFTEELRGLERVAQTVGWAYLRDSVKGYDVTTIANTTFISLINTFQYSFTANIKTYVVYVLPTAASMDLTGGHWGQIGCASKNASDTLCFYVARDGTAKGWNTTTNSDDSSMSASNAYIEQRMPGLLSVAATATKGSALAASGVWTQTSNTRCMFSDKTMRTTSYLIPIAFNDEGYATAMAGVDVSVELLMDTVNVAATPNIEFVVVDNRYNAGEGGQFVYDSFNASLFWSTPYGVRTAPVNRIRDLAESIWIKNGGALAVNRSFYQNGLIYQSLTMMSHWTLIASSPLALSVAEVATMLSAFVREIDGVAAAASGLVPDCETSSNNQRNSVTVESFGLVEHAFGRKLQSLYTSYALDGVERGHSSGMFGFPTADAHKNGPYDIQPPSSATAQTLMPLSVKYDLSSMLVASVNSSEISMEGQEVHHLETEGSLISMRNVNVAKSARSGGAAERKWGVCGCTYSSVTETRCFYTNSNEVEIVFDGSIFSESSKDKIETRIFASTRRSSFTKRYIEGTPATTGFWTKPYVGNDTITGEVSVAVSYVYPSTHDDSGSVTRAVVIDTIAAWMANTLRMNQYNGTTALYLIDRRDAGTFLASSAPGQVVSAVHTALNTPDPEFNRIANAVYSTAGNSWEHSLSFHIGPTLVNYQIVEGQWGVIEVIPGDVALQRYLPTPAVTGATDALRLLPPGETVQLFLYVAGILSIFFLNLLILGCSKLGQL